METIISLLVLGAVYLISYVMKSLSASQGEEGGKPVFGEGFPTIEVLKPESPASPVAPDAVATPIRRVEPAVTPKRVSTPLPQAENANKNLKNENCTKKERLVALKSKSDAKRAFIYSEIFDRKY